MHPLFLCAQHSLLEGRSDKASTIHVEEYVTHHEGIDLDGGGWPTYNKLGLCKTAQARIVRNLVRLACGYLGRIAL